MLLTNKVAVITGSSSGIGKATALLFAKEGSTVIINNRKNRKEGLEVVDLIQKRGGKAFYIPADVTKPKEVQRLFQKTVKAYGTVDILINNAGIIHPKPFLELTAADWEKTFHTNMIGVFLCAQEAAKIMLRKKRGKIINISSVRGLEHAGRPGIMDYCASKAAVINFTKTLAKELAPHITVNSVAPGPAATVMTDIWTKSYRKKALKEIYLHRLMQPEEIAQALLYLASPAAAAVTGEVLVVDGGNNLK